LAVARDRPFVGAFVVDLVVVLGVASLLAFADAFAGDLADALVVALAGAFAGALAPALTDRLPLLPVFAGMICLLRSFAPCSPGIGTLYLAGFARVARNG
jgi:hypothetical protein